MQNTEKVDLSDQEFACLIFRSCGKAMYIESALGRDHASACRICSGELVTAYDS